MTLCVSFVPAPALAAGGSQGFERAFAGTYAEGEALVLYRTSVSGGAVALLSEDGEAEAAIPGDAETDVARAEGADLVDAGFEMEGFWDLSAVDEAVDGSASLLSVDGDGDFDAGVADSASGIATGGDVRIALVRKDGASTADLVEELETLDCVIAAQPNYSFEIASDVEPNDTFYQAGYQYSLYDDATQGASGATSGGISAAGATNGSMGTETARAARANGTQENVVAVVDTGVDYTNPDLADVMWSRPADSELDGPLPGEEGSHGWNGVTGTDDPAPIAGYGNSHGTHCAGIIAAASDNAQGIAGNSADTKIMGLRIDDDAGALKNEAIASCFQYLIQAKLAGVNVVAVNCSWIVGSYAPVIDYLVNQAGRAGILSIIGAGNDDADMGNHTLDGTAAVDSPYAIHVAATNSQNHYTSFSNYSGTIVDLAAPGSRILSTVSKSAAQQFYYPILAKTEGQSFAYYQDFSGADWGADDFDVKVSFGEEDVTDELAGQVSVAVVEDPDYAYLEGSWLELSLTYTQEMLDDMAASLEEADSPTYYTATVSWKESGADCLPGSIEARDYILGYSTASDIDTTLRSYGTVSIADQAESETLASIDFRTTRDTDAYLTNDEDEYDNAVKGASDDDKTVSFSVHIGEGGGNDLVAGKTYKTAVTAIGAGKKDDAPAYAFMSGTSMAAPQITGVVAQMAALTDDDCQTDADALVVRGEVVGSTVKVEESYSGTDVSAGRTRKSTATDGRFSWDVALGDDGTVDATALNANTWGATTDTHDGAASTQTVTLRGYALEGASVAVDGEAATVVASANESITLALPTATCDGAYHDFVVADAQSGRTYQASYALDAVEATGAGETAVAGTMTLTQVGSLPTVEAPYTQATGVLVSSGESLYFADGYGRYVYRSTDLTGSSWEKLEIGDWSGEPGASADEPWVAYACLDGALYAFQTATTSDEAAGTFAISPYVNRYDPTSGTWSGFALAGDPVTQEDMPEGFAHNPSFGGSSAFAYQGKMYFLVDFTVYNKGQNYLIHAYTMAAAQTGTTDFGSIYINDGTEEGATLLYSERAIATDAGIVAFGQREDGETGAVTFGFMSFDDEEQAWHDEGTVAGSPAQASSALALNAVGTASLVADNGILLLGSLFDDGAEARFVNLATGSWDLLSVEGDVLSDGAKVVPLGGVMTCEGYLVAGVGGDGAADGALYAATFSEGAGVEHAAVTLAAQATEGGTASVEGCGIAHDDGSLAILRHNNATWKATPAQGYSFAGWYDADGDLVSSDPAYAQAVADGQTLAARFTAAAPDVPGVGSGELGGGAGSGGSTSANASARPLAKTADSLLPLALAAFATLVAAGVGLVAFRRRA